ncbi:MAG: F0F1 ATP synthase subunit delta [Prevotellaceae bacterium]|jgi:F-type H+-transporting ATPase subunit delta|nr:F0F1 ATP synthase subunit delta [Prevotellaceae bacterium]
MNLSLISNRYARALLAFAKDNGVEQVIHSQMKQLVNVYNELPQLSAIMINPILPVSTKKETLYVAVEQPNDVYKRFIDLVIKNGRETLLRNIALKYESLYCTEKNIVKGMLVTAVEPPAEVIASVERIFKTVINGTLELTTKVEPQIEGGFVLTFDTYRLDSSVKRQLRTIKKQFEVENSRMG